MLYSILATSGNAMAQGVWIGVLVFCIIALLIALCVGLKKGIRRVSWLGVTWFTTGLAFCILQANVGEIFADALQPLISEIPLAGSAVAFLPPFILACACLLVCLSVHGIVALILRPRRKFVRKKADVFVKDDDWVEYDDEADDYDDYEQYASREIVQKSGYLKPKFLGRLFGGLACMLHCAMVLASVLLLTLFILQATPLKDTVLKDFLAMPNVPELVTFTKNYALDFVMIGITVAFLLNARNKGFMETLRSIVVCFGGLVLIGFCFYVPFSPIASENGIWLFHSIVSTVVNAKRGMAGNYAPIVGGILAGLAMSIIAIILIVLVNMLFKFIIKTIKSVKLFFLIDGVLAVLFYFVVAIAVCLLFWTVATIFSHFGLSPTLLFTEKSTLSSGFFAVCQAYVEPVIANIESYWAQFFSSIQ